MRNVTKFDRENGAKFGPKCCEIKQLRSNICYEFSEQYQLGNNFSGNVTTYDREKISKLEPVGL